LKFLEEIAQSLRRELLEENEEFNNAVKLGSVIWGSNMNNRHRDIVVSFPKLVE
jgi:hypothetical protein